MLPEITQDTLADTASLFAESSRATMLLALLDGRTCTAGELARFANISPQAASFHLKRLACSNLLKCETRGKYRYFRLAGPEIAQFLETLLAFDQIAHPRKLAASRSEASRDARTCYNHLAGRAGVHLYRRLTDRGWLAFEGSQLILTSQARELAEELDCSKDSSLMMGKPCLDWSERDLHIAGELGGLLLKSMLDRRWFLRSTDRALIVTEKGRSRLAQYNLYPWTT
ncbi:MAG: helix-turn-helix domain-containing protein [Steroidobacteraceae bacterium]